MHCNLRRTRWKVWRSRCLDRNSSRGHMEPIHTITTLSILLLADDRTKLKPFVAWPHATGLLIRMLGCHNRKTPIKRMSVLPKLVRPHKVGLIVARTEMPWTIRGPGWLTLVAFHDMTFRVLVCDPTDPESSRWGVRELRRFREAPCPFTQWKPSSSWQKQDPMSAHSRKSAWQIEYPRMAMEWSALWGPRSLFIPAGVHPLVCTSLERAYLSNIEPAAFSVTDSKYIEKIS